MFLEFAPWILGCGDYVFYRNQKSEFVRNRSFLNLDMNDLVRCYIRKSCKRIQIWWSKIRFQVERNIPNPISQNQIEIIWTNQMSNQSNLKSVRMAPEMQFGS